MEPLAATPIVTKEDYYKDTGCISFSSVKVFSRCETLYRDLFVDKTYEEPEYDYFVYGKLVDAMISEPEAFIAENFVRVERKIKAEDALRFENTITMLRQEIKDKEEKIESKRFAKKNEIQEKIDKLKSSMDAKKLKKPDVDLTKDGEKLTGFLNDMKEIPADKTLEKGIESRKAEIAEVQKNLDLIKEMADKIQVTNSVWINAEETAQAIKSHPSFSNLEFNQVTSQQIFRSNRGGIPRKGKLDHLKLSPALTKFYAIYAAGQMTLEELQGRIRADVHPEDLWAIITDIKTCRDIKTLEPYNNHYRGQLGFYQDLVSDTLLIPIDKIRCRILAADKLNNDFKKCELFEYSQPALDELKPDVEAWIQIWWNHHQARQYISAKAKHGWHQDCYTCSECRFCPFSMKPGEPVMVSGKRFDSNAPRSIGGEELSTADAMIDY